jgi:hypothetical protein
MRHADRQVGIGLLRVLGHGPFRQGAHPAVRA